MDDDDWDLQAVVRGCAANFAATTASTTTTSVPVPAPVAATAATTYNHPFPSFPSNLPYYDDPNSFDFSGLVDDKNDPFQGFQEIYQELCVDDQPPPTAATAGVPATSIVSLPPPLVLQQHQHIMQVGPAAPLLFNMQIQENVQFNMGPTFASPPQNFPVAIPHPVRPRRRKNQQTKMIRQMTQDELAADSWAWRKYGQKPIKGSPYPRNYYRCSTSKGCAARKQVERSSHDPELFVVSYSGEHTHPRPTHRSSLSGSTRSKFASPTPKSGGGGINAILSGKGPMTSSSSSPAAGSSFSPSTPSMEGEAAAENDDVHMVQEDDEENEITIPNDLMNDDDDMFRAFQDSDDHSSGGDGGGDFFSGGLLSSPPWTPTSSGGNSSAFNGGGS